MPVIPARGLMALAIVGLAGYAPTAARAESQTYECTGGQAPFAVPAGVTQLHVEAHGGQGQTRGGSLSGGFGGIVIATVPVTPGETVQVIPGCAGNQHHNFGWGVGGDHGIAHSALAEDGGFGGGGSAVTRLDGAELVVAGGGGGDGGDGGGGGEGGQGGAGGNGGIDPQPGEQGFTPGHENGGDGGCAACASGIDGGGGTSSSALDDGGGGGGGGGGHVGGGGGHGGSGFIFGQGGGGGGGGSSFVIGGATNVRYGTNSAGGDGIVILSWSVGASDGRLMPVLLAPLEGKADGEARGINSWGEVAGFGSDGVPLATVWDRDGRPRALAPLEGDRASQGFAINDWGEVAGDSRGATTSAVRWPRHGPPLRLAPPEGDQESFARGINRHGEVAGWSARRSDAGGNGTVLQAVRWSADGTPTVLAPLDGDLEAMALAINDRGLVAGYSFSPGDPVHDRAVVWNQHGEPTALSEADSEATAINRRGHVAGDLEDDLEAAALWPAGRAPRNLAALDGELEGQAFAINRRGTAAGVSRADTATAVIWPRGGAPVALDPLPGDQESWAWGINRGGDVVGFSSGAAGSTAVLWPAPRQKRPRRPFGRP